MQKETWKQARKNIEFNQSATKKLSELVSTELWELFQCFLYVFCYLRQSAIHNNKELKKLKVDIQDKERDIIERVTKVLHNTDIEELAIDEELARKMN